MREDDRRALIGQMFALITAKYEDGAGRSIDGQVPNLDIIHILIDDLRQKSNDILHLLNAVDVVRQERD